MNKRTSLLIDLLVVVIGLTGMSFGQVPPTPPSVIRVTNVVQAEVSPLSAQLRKALREERESIAWKQRLVVVEVVTNYVVTYAPAGTNTPTFQFPTSRPTKKGDEFELFPK